jgi:hypothetical protein
MYTSPRILITTIVAVLWFSGCDDVFEKYNTDQRKPEEVPAGYLFSNALRSVADNHGSTARELNNWKLFAQYWTLTTYLNEANYDVVFRNVASNMYSMYYRNILANLHEARKIMLTEEIVNHDAESVLNNRLAALELTEIFVWQQMVTIFGDIPYSEALNVDNVTPVYDDAQFIYEDLLLRAEQAVNRINPVATAFGTEDLLFGGDMLMWLKFGNTLRVKMAMFLVDINTPMSRSHIEKAWSAAFVPGELAAIAYPAGVYPSPLHKELVQSGRQDFVPANTIVDLMNVLEDPRRASYFDINGDTYRGGTYGAMSPYFQYSHIHNSILSPTRHVVLLDYTELAFYLAEATSRGFDTGNTAAYWYNSGIQSSMIYWNVVPQEATQYLQQTDVAFNPMNWKENIGTQSWLAFYLRGLEGWTSWRRLGYPAMNLPPNPDPLSDGMVPVRHTYPIAEQTLNPKNYSATTKKIGGDRLSTPIFWFSRP